MREGVKGETGRERKGGRMKMWHECGEVWNGGKKRVWGKGKEEGV